MKNKKGSMQPRKERRVVSLPKQKFEIRSNTDGSRTVSGYASVFNALSGDFRGWRERVLPGAYAKSLANGGFQGDVYCYYEHDPSKLLGRRSAGTLTVVEDDIGLKFSVTLPDTTLANDIIVLMERGDLHQMSIGFFSLEDNWIEQGDVIIREQVECDLIEVSIVGNPVFKQTTANLHSMPAEIKSKLNLRDADEDEDDEADCDPAIDDDCLDNEDDECSCECDACMDDDCANCTGEECDDENCEACPMQDEQRSDSLRVRSLFAHKMNT